MTEPPPTAGAPLRWKLPALLVVLLAAAAWLWLAPPRIELPNSHEVVTCNTLAWRPAMEGSLFTVTPEQHDAIERYLGSKADDPAYWEGKEDALVQRCDEARQNQQTFLFVILTAVLAVLIVIRTTHQAIPPTEATTTTSNPEPTTKGI